MRDKDGVKVAFADSDLYAVTARDVDTAKVAFAAIAWSLVFVFVINGVNVADAESVLYAFTRRERATVKVALAESVLYV